MLLCTYKTHVIKLSNTKNLEKKSQIYNGLFNSHCVYTLKPLEKYKLKYPLSLPTKRNFTVR